MFMIVVCLWYRLKKGGIVSGRSIEVAYEQCLRYLGAKNHDDIDIAATVSQSINQPINRPISKLVMHEHI